MLIDGEFSNLEVNLIRRSHPESNDYWDGNWITSELRANLPGFTARISLELRSDELFNLLKSLPQIINGSANGFEFRTLEDSLYIKVEAEPTGTINWHCKITYPVGDGAVLQFSINSDFSQIHSLMKQLEIEMQSYPVIGNP